MGEANRRIHSRNASAFQRLNELANIPEIREALAPGLEEIDLSPIFFNPANIIAFEGNGAMVFVAIPDRPDWYDAHFLFPRAKGRTNLDNARRAINAAFAEYGASVIMGNTPRDNRAARIINRALGSKPIGEGVSASGRHCIGYVLERETWATFSAGSLERQATT